jgi:hypothetical protein
MFGGVRSRGTFASPTVVGSGDYLLALTGNGYNGTSYTTDNPVSVLLNTEGIWTETSTPTRIVFGTTAIDETIRRDRFYITSSGNLINYTDKVTNGGINTSIDLLLTDAVSVEQGIGTGIIFRTRDTESGGRVGGGIDIWKESTDNNNTASAMRFFTREGGVSPTEKLRITGAGNIVLGSQTALATNATNGFTYLPTCAGAPTGSATSYTGKAPFVVDTTNNRLYIRVGATWRYTTLT